jgi:4-hydroxy-2-oxoheptanedioate aldolase
MTRDLKALLESDRVSLGTWSQIAAPEMVDLIGLNGFEFTIIDCEHGHFGIETAENLARAADANDIACAVRVSRNDPVEIMKALDAGIRHVVVPGIASHEEAARAVAATRFAPHGLRGACPCCRSGGHYIRNWQDYVDEEEARVGVIGLIESAEGYRNIRRIVDESGLRALMFGPFDLSVSMGHSGDWRHPEVASAVREMIRITVDAGHRVMMPVFSTDKDECKALMDDYAEMGATSFVLGSDKILVASAFADWTDRLGAVRQW